MVIMALDHARDFLAIPGLNPTNLDTTTVSLFFTRWITYICAPVFFLLTGTGARLALRRRSTKGLARFFDADEPVHALVAEGNGQLLGLAHYLFHRSTTAIAPICYLQDLFTAESARGCGIARALIAEVYAQAKSAGSSRVYWQTHETNHTAQRLYDKVAERSGFIVYRKPL